jgi:DNA-binding NtrC family response regulator
VVRAVRETHLDVACVIVTGFPDVRSAVEALRLGVFDYLIKSEAVDNICEVVARAGTGGTSVAPQAGGPGRVRATSAEPGDLIGLDLALTRTIDQLWMEYQPIVKRDGSLYGYER